MMKKLCVIVLTLMLLLCVSFSAYADVAVTQDLHVAKNWRTADGNIDNTNLRRDVTDALLLYILSADGTETLVKDADGTALKPVREEGADNNPDLYWWRGVEILPEGSQYIVKEDPNKVPDGFVVDYNGGNAYVSFLYDSYGGWGTLYNTYRGFANFLAFTTVDGKDIDASFNFELVDAKTSTIVAQGSSSFVPEDESLFPGMPQNTAMLRVTYDGNDLPATTDGVTEYYYILREVAGTGNYIYDTTEYEFKVTIDRNGKVTQYIKVGDGYQPYNTNASTFDNKEATEVAVGKAWKNADGTTTAPAGATVVFTLCANDVETAYTVTLDGKADTAAPTTAGGYESEP